jgi:predicted AAA+ superfamily ATPase
MESRPWWIRRLTAALSKRNVVWLSGVRRVGKTTLARSLEGVRYCDCELVRVRNQLADPETFFAEQSTTQTIVLDEIHRLQNPSEVLKIAADHFPKSRVIATGSSTLAARSKFKDSLTGRKVEIWLTPMLYEDLRAFGSRDFDRRMLHGGLPPFFLAEAWDDYAYQEWMDSYWAKDLSELYAIDKKASFMRFFELLLTQSGQLFEAQSLTVPCEVSRQTLMNYLTILETTLVVTVLRPFHTNASTEIRSQPKVYGFDTGFVAYCKGIETLRDEDRGLFLEHMVLDELVARHGRAAVHFWRDKQKHEVDFILQRGRSRAVTAIECKLQSKYFDPTGLRAFRKLHPEGENWLVSLKDRERFVKRDRDLSVKVIPFAEFGEALDEPG